MFDTPTQRPREAEPLVPPTKQRGVRRRWAIHYRQIVAMRDSQATGTSPGSSRPGSARPPT